MPRWLLLMWLLHGMWLVFALALGACIGSLINVLAYRMPLGISVVSPPSRCPSCGTRLTWRENIPVFGWVLLRGKCRFCKSRISPEYPIVEASVAVLFGVLFATCYMLPRHASWLGVDWGLMRPEWALGDPRQTWPIFLVVLSIFGSLAAMTIVDAKTFTIPLQLAWFPALVGVVVHPLWAWRVQVGAGELRRHAPGWEWAIPTPGMLGWGAVGAGIGGVVGIGVGLLLIRVGLIRRSFEDYEEWERGVLGGEGGDGVEGPGVDGSAADSLRPVGDSRTSPPPGAVEGADTDPHPSPSPHAGEGGEADRELALAARADVVVTGEERGADGVGRSRGARWVVGVSMVVCPVAGAVLAPVFGVAGGWGLLIGAVAGPLVGGLASLPFRWGRSVSAGAEEGEEAEVSAPEMWTKYPHARREMVRELAFLCPCVLLMIAGWWVAVRLAGPWSMHPVTGDLVPSVPVPLWLSVLGGVLVGYLVGGGVVWAVRILGSLAFGKEAMGLGDVHLMAAVGVCLGWIDATVAFFLAAFVGVFWAILGQVYSGGLARAMPYGPFLAVATLLVFLGKPVLEWGIGAMAGASGPVSLP